MKNYFLLTICAIMMTQNSAAQIFEIYYFDTPQAIDVQFASGTLSEETGFKKVLITTGNVATFKRVAPPALLAFYNKLADNNSEFRKSVNRVIRISNGYVTKITFNIVNDRLGPPVGASQHFFCWQPTDTRMAAWPCALNDNTSGSVFFGEVAAGAAHFESVVLHELSHTQTRTDSSNLNSRYGIKNSIIIAYGGESGHFANELMGDQQTAMDEALGTFLGAVYDPLVRKSYLDKFSANSDYFLGSHSLLTGTSEVWNAPHRVLVDTVFQTTVVPPAIVRFKKQNYTIKLNRKSINPGQRYIARLYKFCNIPAEHNFNSELLTQVYLHMYSQEAFQASDSALNSITRFANYYSKPTPFQKHRYPFSMAMFLANDMEVYSQKSIARGSTEKFVSSIFPLALYDLLMHFDLTDAELLRVFTISTYDMPGLKKIPKSKAFLQYFILRNTLKNKLLPVLYRGRDCKSDGTLLDINAAAKELRDFCKTEAILSLTKVND